jgi:hypothetical protein
VILRPSVITGRPAYGGSALFRGLAGLPLLPLLSQAGKLQVVQLDEVVATIMFFLRPGAPAKLQLGLPGPDRLSFEEVVGAYRDWHGWKPARSLSLPAWMMLSIAWETLWAFLAGGLR